MRKITFKDILDYLDSRGAFKFMPDELYLKFMFRLRMHRKLNLENPQCFNDKIQWIKLNDRRPEYTVFVDKYAVKKHIAERIGEKYIIPTLGVWEKFDDIDFQSLPNQFVLKCTHDSETSIPTTIEKPTYTVDGVLHYVVDHTPALIGVAIGTLVAMTYQTVWMAVYDSKHLIQWPIKNFLKQVFVDIITVFIGYFSTRMITMQEVSYFAWMILALKTAAVWSLIAIAINTIFYRSKVLRIMNRFLRKRRCI